jgi:hypothetical protein
MDPELQMTDEDREFAEAFNSDELPSAGEGAGLDAEEAAEVTGDESGEESPDGADDAVMPAEAAPAAAAAVAPPAEDDEIEKERQRLRSWEGRLRAEAARLAAKGGEGEAEAASDKLEKVSDKAASGGSEELAAAAAAAAEAVESGEMSPEEAMRVLEEDFGAEFTGMVKSIASATAKQAVSEVSKQFESKFEEVELRRHYDTIAAAHPDYKELSADEKFSAYINSLPPADRETAIKVVEGGSAQQVISLLSGYKKKAAGSTAAAPGQQAAPAAEKAPAKADTPNPADEEAAESLEGVRSGGVRVPQKPAMADAGYEEAWEKF